MGPNKWASELVHRQLQRQRICCIRAMYSHVYQSAQLVATADNMQDMGSVFTCADNCGTSAKKGLRRRVPTIRAEETTTRETHMGWLRVTQL